MNINALRDADNDPGFYAAASSSAKSWPGATMYQSVDNGASYQAVTTFTTRATMGRTINALGSFEGGNTVDELNAVTVSLTYGTLVSVTYANLLEGAQAALIGDEVVYFRDAILNSSGLYTLRGLLRGRRGTEGAINTHVIGDRFVLLTPATVKRIPQVTDDINKTRLYKMVTSAASLSSAPAQSFTNLGAGLKPYAPVQIGGGSDASGNLTITWARRTRISGEWRDIVDVPLGEASEAYEVDVMDASFSTVKRTIGGLTSPVAVYSAADQVADGIGADDSVYFQVYQLSPTVGRGYPGRAALRHIGGLVAGGGSGGGGSTGPVAPTLTSPAAAQTGTSTASGSVSTNQGNGTLFSLFSPSSTATAAQVKAGLSQTVNASGTQYVNAAGLAPSTTYHPHYLHRNTAGLDSAVATGASFTTAASGGGGGGGGVSTATVTYPASTAVITNPERGFYVHLVHGGDFSSGNLNTYKAQNMSLVLYQAYLTAYKNAPLDSAFLNAFQANLNSIRSNGMKTILRFAYTQTDTVDASLSRIQGHLDQLAAYLAPNSDVILGMQCGFVGRWGEFQGSDNFGSDSWPPNLTTASKAARKAVVDKALSVMPSNRFVQVRQPWIKMDAYGSTPLSDSTKFSGSAASRIGHFNDCFLSGSTDSGTYWQQTSEEAFLAADTKYVPMGGETCTFNEPRSSGTTAISEMTRFHWSFVNSGYHEQVIQSWKNSGDYTTIAKRLGYRLSLSSGTYPTGGVRGAAMSVSLSLSNGGFAAPFAARTVKLVLRNTATNTTAVLPLSVDLRNWLPGSTITVSESVAIPAGISAGSYKLLLWLPDPAPGLASNPAFAIQLANTGMWESTTGYNDLGHTITIS
jgi:hypothetical protein